MTQPTHTIRLPYPPSINHYWRRVGAKTLISRGGRQYRQDVLAAVLTARLATEAITGRVGVHLGCVMPDRRRRDLDNLPKALLDAIVHAGVLVDDSQIDDLRITRDGVEKPGFCDVTIVELTADDRGDGDPTRIRGR